MQAELTSMWRAYCAKHARAFQRRLAHPRRAEYEPAAHNMRVRAFSSFPAPFQSAQQALDNDSDDEFSWMPVADTIDGADAFANVSSTLHEAVTPPPDAFLRQYELESQAVRQTVQNYREMVADVIRVGKGSSLGPVQRMLVTWFAPLAEAIDKEQRDIWNKESSVDRNAYGPYMVLLPPEVLAVITMHEVINHTLFTTGNNRVGSIALAIGRAVQTEINVMKLRQDNRRTWEKLQVELKTSRLHTVRHHARKALESEQEWPARVCIKLGTALIHLLLQTAKLEVAKADLSQHLLWLESSSLDRKTVARTAAMEAGSLLDFDDDDDDEFEDDTMDDVELSEEFHLDEEPDIDDSLFSLEEMCDRNNVTIDETGSTAFIPAFKHGYMYHKRKVYGVVLLHPSLRERLAEAFDTPYDVAHYPMLVPPQKWSGWLKGGYLKHKVSIMRTRKSELQVQALHAAHMPQVYEALNVLGSVPWRINGFVHDVCAQLWADGGGVAELPSRIDLPIPEEPNWSAFTDEEELRRAKKLYVREVQHINKLNGDLHSLRCDMILKLNVAEKMRNDLMYFPFNMDFRGRVYPIPPHLNHMGADVCRGLLTFGFGKPLGERGLWWLKVHLANLMGKDKASFEERAAFTEANMDQVFDSADNPLKGQRWWLSADSPWQALATCNELRNAYRSGDPASYVCNLPVHQDGSCNGLQHYAAIGRDALGGAAVNLTPSDRPQDVYMRVCDLVIRKVEQDAKITDPPSGLSDREYAQWKLAHECAKFVRGQVTRKVVKQTVMTSVYGVTFIGARDQIRNRLREVFADLALPIDEKTEKINEASAYLARVTLNSLGEMFHAADAIKEWLATAARMVASEGEPMAWITPLGLPVVQPYRRETPLTVKTVMQTVVVAESSEQLPVSANRQRSAFPPNYVHSLDSTHMMLTALDCTAKGLAFTAVHDSYWTHACDIDVMNASLRQQFVHLYSLPLLEQLRDSLVLRFPTLNFPELPERGELDLREVLESPYFFS